MRVFHDNLKEEKVTHPLEKKTQTKIKPHYGVYEKDTSVRITTVW